MKNAIEQNLSCEIETVNYVGGGSINQTANLGTNRGSYFVKWNSKSRFPGMFEAEEKGLHILRECSGFVVPKVITSGKSGDTAFLVMDFIRRSTVDWTEAGLILANMHRYRRVQTDTFGLEHDNYIGSLRQSNRIHNTWAEFFSEERILPQMKLAIDEKRLNTKDLTAAENFCKKIGDIFPEEKPSLLHGDLWSGNFMFTENGPAIFDPAVYWGHREMDIAMSRLFGGFETEFYEAYNEDYPLGNNWENRIDYCNLYPLLVHVNLFGGGYVQDVKNILRQFT